MQRYLSFICIGIPLNDIYHRYALVLQWLPYMYIYVCRVASRDRILAHLTDFHILMDWIATGCLQTYYTKFEVDSSFFCEIVDPMHHTYHLIYTCNVEIWNGGMPLSLIEVAISSAICASINNVAVAATKSSKEQLATDLIQLICANSTSMGDSRI